MLSVWDEAMQRHEHVSRFAMVHKPVTQTTVDMGGVTTFTAVLHSAAAPASTRMPIPLEYIKGPLIMLEPDPSNEQGHAETYRFFAMPGRHGLM
jgi:hypothetical protein